MADDPVAANVGRDSGIGLVIKKRWRAWLRAFHRDFGYLAIGFTVIYAISGIAQNHIEDWGEVSYRTYEQTKTITAIPDELPDDQAIAKVASMVDFGTPTSSFRAGDEIRLEYASGAKVTVIGTQATIQGRERRAFIGVANWLHTARNKKGWKYVADVYAILLLYLAISGIFMIKGKLGLKGRGALLITAGIAVPVLAVLTSGPSARKSAPAATTATAPTAAPMPTRIDPATPPAPMGPEAPKADDGSAESGIKFLPPEPEEGSGSAAEPAKPTCDPFGNMHGCEKQK